MLGLCHGLHIHWPLTIEAQVQSQGSPCGIYDGQSDTRTGYFLNTLVFPSHFHCTSVQYSYVFHVSSSLYNFSKWGHY